MYHTKKIPEPFRNKPKMPQPAPQEVSVPVETKEKPADVSVRKCRRSFPLAALVFLELFSTQKKDV